MPTLQPRTVNYYYLDLMKKANIKPNLIVYNTIVKMWADHRKNDMVEKTVKEMIENGVEPNDFTYRHVDFRLFLSPALFCVLFLWFWLRYLILC